jgi:hypothetical protein|tara:strand:- start:423 stop:725 length:303 start_codon:yes stop_codon:yes gene_type:complete
MYKKTKGYSSGGKVKSKGMKNGGAMKSKGMKLGGLAKGILRTAYKAKTAPLQVASKVVGAAAPASRLAKGLNRAANPRILKKSGGRVNSKGYAKGGKGKT